MNEHNNKNTDTMGTLEESKQNFIQPKEVIQTFNIKEGMSFVDFGSGTGSYISLASDLVGETGAVYAVDIQKDLLLKLKKEIADGGAKNVKFLWCNIEQVGATMLNNESVNIVLMSNILFQLENKHGAFLEAQRILKKGGKLIVIDWKDSFNGMGPDKEYIIKKDIIMELAESTGFTLDSELDPGHHHYQLTFTRESKFI